MILFFLLTIAYVIIMLLYRKGWDMQEAFQFSEGYNPKTKISIIIPARNEEENIPVCIYSILNQKYPENLYEIIVVDDHSADKTAIVVGAVRKKNVQCIRLADHIKATDTLIAYKKKALAVGIAHASGELIVTTDADCITGKEWLKNIAALYEEKHPIMIVGAVDFSSNETTLQQFQSLDFIGMQGITVATHRLKMGTMCNGANLAFSKEAYYAVRGYDGIDHIASGDDYLLMMKMQKAFPDKIEYLKNKNAVVRTKPQSNWADFFQQRIRWASKSGKYGDNKLTTVLLLVYVFNLSFLVVFIGGFIKQELWLAGIIMLVVKIAAELYFITPVSRFFDKEKQLKIFPFLQLRHIVYIIIAGFLGFIGTYEWKGRKVK